MFSVTDATQFSWELYIDAVTGSFQSVTDATSAEL